METRTTASSSKRTSTRSSNACTRCRKQKIKCSGLQPCAGCTKRRATCNFDDSDDKVVVTRAFLTELQQKAARVTQQTNDSEQPSWASQASSVTGGGLPTQPTPRIDRDGGSENSMLGESFTSGPRGSKSSKTDRDREPGNDSNESQVVLPEGQGPDQGILTNPLAASPSTFMATASGRPFYLGTSSNWSFSGKVLQLTHENVHQAPFPSQSLLFDGLAYDLGWRGSFDSTDLGLPAIPSPDHSIYLVNAVKFHCGQMFHLFDDEEFHRRLQQFYAQPDHQTRSRDLWYIHFLLILAFGKIFMLQKSVGKRPSGAEFFVKAMELLPPVYVLCQDPVAATEILSCIALYLQCVDHRVAAYVYIGQAMRMGLGYGMHTDMPVAQLGESHVQRCRKIWWTIYVLDRQMTSMMGEPQSIQDGEIHCQLPVFHESNFRTTTLEMHINLARTITQINNNIYGANGRLNGKFLSSTKASLETLAGLAGELSRTVPLRLDEDGYGIPRISATLHLLYHQCIILATRPLLFCCLKMKFEAAEYWTDRNHPAFDNIIQTCIDSSQAVINILENLHSQGLLETFLTVDLDALHASSIILAIGPLIDKQHTKDPMAWAQRLFMLLDNMITAGNLVATARKQELKQLDEMVIGLLNNRASESQSSDVPRGGPAFQHTFPAMGLSIQQDGMLLPPLNTMGLCGGDDLSADQIIAVAGSIQEEDVEWMNRAIAENSIW